MVRDPRGAAAKILSGRKHLPLDRFRRSSWMRFRARRAVLQSGRAALDPTPPPSPGGRSGHTHLGSDVRDRSASCNALYEDLAAPRSQPGIGMSHIQHGGLAPEFIADRQQRSWWEQLEAVDGVAVDDDADRPDAVVERCERNSEYTEADAGSGGECADHQQAPRMSANVKMTAGRPMQKTGSQRLMAGRTVRVGPGCCSRWRGGS